jgi:hypothetical protein
VREGEEQQRPQNKRAEVLFEGSEFLPTFFFLFQIYLDLVSDKIDSLSEIMNKCIFNIVMQQYQSGAWVLFILLNPLCHAIHTMKFNRLPAAHGFCYFI